MPGNIEDGIPVMVSVKGYGIFWDNYSPTTFGDNANETYFESEVGDMIDYYFMAADNMEGVISEMRNLTYEVPMFPLWTYGFWQSRERYKTQDETVGVVKKHREPWCAYRRHNTRLAILGQQLPMECHGIHES